mgnify:CR=1 FL=1
MSAFLVLVAASGLLFFALVEMAFTLLMRLPERLEAERESDGGALGSYLDDPLRFFVPARLMRGLLLILSIVLLAQQVDHGWIGAGVLVGSGLLLAIGLLATAAQMMMTRAYRIGRTLSNASLQYLGIVFSFVFGVLLFDDPVTGMALAGMVLIVIAGLAATLLRSRQQHDTTDTRSPPNET